VSTDPQPHLPTFQAAFGPDGRVHLEIRGDLDITTVPLLAGQLARLSDSRPTELTIDMSGVSFLDCASARLLADTAAFLPQGRQPVLVSVGPAVRRLLQLTGLDEIMHIASGLSAPHD
jgi:anti-anti-sigma factor